ncbi:hypothetical protein BDN67DRAFT_970673 [Paxillus ammoniavirescens]|nr:hypothetical protein BDN67DRAFT_970673 [Paxillus ammoniavirescens]
MTSLWPSATLLLLVHSCYSSPTNVSTSPDPQADVVISAFVCNNVRSLWSIILTCLISLAACSWNAVHPNIPGVDDGRWIIFFRRLGIMALVVIAPELLLLWALQQFICAGLAADAFNKWRAPPDTPDDSGAALQTPAIAREPEEPDTITELPRKDRFEAWNRTHGFFAEMGGFQLYVNSVSHCPLTVQELTRFIDDGSVSVPHGIKEADISDRSKNDAFNKFLVVSQLAWFAFKFIVRVAYRLPNTLLEVETFGLVILSFVTWGLWWKKPKDVRIPFRVDWKPAENPGDLELCTITRRDLVHALLLSLPMPISLFKSREITNAVSSSAVKARRVPIFHSGCVGQRAEYDKYDKWASFIFSGTAAVFGAVHLFSPSYPFASLLGQLAWLVATGYMIAIPFFVWLLERRFHHWQGDLPLVQHLVLYVYTYIAIRLMVFVLIVWSFSSLPSGTYDAVCWTASIPQWFS